MTKKAKFIVAGYVRLSHDAGEHPSSIETQKEMIRHFVGRQEDMIFHRFYVDNGVSSFASTRSEFQQLIEDIKSGICNCIVVKDLSRFGRDYIETGRFIFSIFPTIGVRFIALADEYDSLHSNMRDEYPLAMQTIANHYYALDISQKVKSAVHFKQKQGLFILSKAPFGYQKHKKDGDTIYTIDDVAAAVVIEIFELRKAGTSPYQIAKALNSRGIPSPKQYEGVNEDGYWCVGTIRCILQNRFYMGTYVAGKTERHLSGRFTKNIPKEQWTVIENHHVPIIDMEIFESVQTNKSLTQAAKNTSYHKNLPSSFDGKIYCGFCGRRMKKQGVSKLGEDKYSYVCPTYADSGGVRCQYNRIRADILKKMVFDILKDKIDSVTEYHSQRRNFDVLPSQKLWLEYRLKKITEYEREIKRYSEEKGAVTWERAIAKENLSVLDFSGIHRYEQSRIKYLECQLAEIRAEIENYENNYSFKANWVTAYLAFKDATALDEKMIDRLIERVTVCNEKVEVALQKTR